MPLDQPLDGYHHRGREDHREAATTSHFPSDAKGGFWAFRLTFRVAEPEVLARHLRFSANGVTARRLGGRSEATEAGNPVLGAVLPSRCLPRWQAPRLVQLVPQPVNSASYAENPFLPRKQMNPGCLINSS